MKNLTCTCGTTSKSKKSGHNCICNKCGKEYYYSNPLGKWLFTQRTHEVKEG